MSKCKVCGADAGFMGVICSACSTERAIELHHYKAQSTIPPKSEDDEDSRPDFKSPIAPSSAAESSGHENADDCSTENQVESSASRSSTWFSELDHEFNDSKETVDSKTGKGAGKFGCGLLLVLALIVGFGLWSLAYAACGLLAVFFGFSNCPQDLFTHLL